MDFAATTQITIEDVRLAAATIDGTAHRTPVTTCQSLNRQYGNELFLKCENLQKVGAFKFRGAFNAIANLTESDLRNGVITHSSGNHAQALALAAKLRSVHATIIMPTGSPRVKRDGVIEYGANVVQCEPTLPARELTMRTEQEKTGAVFVPPYNHPHIIAGQGTAALELLEKIPDLDVVVAPVGGGGLLSGTAITAKSIRPSIRVIGAEPAGADDAFRSFTTGKLVPQTNPKTVCDGLLTSLGDITWPIIRRHVDQIITVEDAEIIEAMREFWQRTKMIIEPSSAVAVAAARQVTADVAGRPLKIGIIISGGNVDIDRLPWN